MKLVKIILGIITVLSVIFLGTGLVIKETKYTAKVEINKPINEVFALFENTDKLQEWLPEIKTIEPIEEKIGKLGSTYKMTIENEGQEIIMTEKIMAYIPNEKLTFQFDSNQMIKTDNYNFIANGNKTKVVQHCSVKAKEYLMACMFPYFKGFLKDSSLEYMNRFKKMVEKN